MARAKFSPLSEEGMVLELKRLCFAAILFWSQFSKSEEGSSYWVAPAGLIASGLLLRSTPQDRDFASWTNENPRVFGTRRDADISSDSLRWILWSQMVVSSIVLPEKWTESSFDRWVHLGLVLVTSEINFATTTAVKDWTKQDRPLNPQARNGFPSAHSSSASLFGEITRQNLKRSDWQFASALDVSTYALVGLVGWSRLEAGQHYPSDVLVGWGWGLLVARSAERLLLPYVFGPRSTSSEVSYSVLPDFNGVSFVLNW